MAMSRDPRSKFQKNLFFLILHLILRKAAKFVVEKLSTSEVISQKPHGEVENTLPCAFRVNPIQARGSLGTQRFLSITFRAFEIIF